MLKTYCISKVQPMELTEKVDFRCKEKRSYLIFQNTILSSEQWFLFFSFRSKSYTFGN